MGLDMFLYREQHITTTDNKITYKDYNTEEEQQVELQSDYEDGMYHATIKTCVADWRKANQIHKWFVDSIQEGKDDCGYYYVPFEHLQRLLDICKKIKKECPLVDGKVQNGYSFNENGEKVYDYEDGKVMTNVELAEKLLPTSEGFFFGGTGYDQWYMQDIEYTIVVLEDIIKNDNGGANYYYTSSW